MGVMTRPALPEEGEAQRWHAYIRCDAIEAGGWCKTASDARTGADKFEAAHAAKAAARAAGWECTPMAGGEDRWRCPRCLGKEDAAAPSTEADSESLTLRVCDPLPQAAPRRRRGQYLPGVVYDIPIGDLMPDPAQPRKLFDAAALAQLAASLATAGQQHPIRFRVRVSPPDGECPLILVDGERRLRAAREAGLATLRGILDPETDSGADLIVRQALLNEPGRPLAPWDWVLTFRHLASEHGLSPAQIAEHLTERGVLNASGRRWSRPQVANYLRLLELPGWVQDLISDGPLTPAHGIYILPHRGRPPVIEHLKTWLSSRQPTPRITAEEDIEHDHSAATADAPPRINKSEGPARITVADLRQQLSIIYTDAGLRMEQGRLLFVGDTHRWVRPEFSWDTPDSPCQGCRQRADLGPRETYCMDTACLLRLNAEAAAERQDQPTEPEPPAPGVTLTFPLQRNTGDPAGIISSDIPTTETEPTEPPAYRRPRADDWEARERVAEAHDAQIKAALAEAEVPQLQALLLWALLRREYLLTAREGSMAPKPREIEEHLAGTRARRFLRSRVADAFERTLNDRDRAVIADYLGLVLESQDA